jgi:hypothetical protein
MLLFTPPLLRSPLLPTFAFSMFTCCYKHPPQHWSRLQRRFFSVLSDRHHRFVLEK